MTGLPQGPDGVPEASDAVPDASDADPASEGTGVDPDWPPHAATPTAAPSSTAWMRWLARSRRRDERFLEDLAGERAVIRFTPIETIP
jgi:hypothetical protein